jgi:GDP-4-dehydro-6-deoxy-D-mannose reductase
MRIFVTGARGFVGSRLVRRLQAQGHEVFGTECETDVTRRAALEAALEEARPDAVIHLAAVSSVAESNADPSLCYRINILGARNVLGAVERLAPRARVLLVGSGDVYGTAQPGAAPFTEDDPFRPRSPYGRSKAAAEYLGTQAAERGFDVLRLRPFNQLGAGQRESFVASSFARQIAEIAAGRIEPVMRVGNLASVRDFIDVEDVLGAYVQLLDPAVPAAVYNIASGLGVTVQILLDLLIELGEVEVRVETDSARMRPTDHMVGDPQRLRSATGWCASTPLRATLASVLGHWREHLT